jgi:DNA invertase Pin-like site-specific DNA recombinase
MAIVSYARVSTQDQHLTGQLEALKAAGVETSYREKISWGPGRSAATGQADGIAEGRRRAAGHQT